MIRNLVISLAIASAAWAAFTWPLPPDFGAAVPAGATKRDGEQRVEHMTPGDHLQLMYHFWLLTDMIRGQTPFFRNVYEFNTGNDAERYEPGSYYVPFSLVFALVAPRAGHAAGWNAASLFALWMTVFFTHGIARRYATGGLAAWSFAALSVAFPYRWISLAGGSPTGFAMAWVPALLLGLDRAVREVSWKGGLLAGIALLLASWGDTHVFFFSALAAPAWCVVAFARENPPLGRDARAWARLALALAPAVVLAPAAYISTKITAGQIETSGVKAGRTIYEVALFSPKAEGLWAWAEHGVSNHIYFGAIAAAFLAAGAVALIARPAPGPRRDWRPTLAYALLLAGIAAVVLLSMGPYGPWEGRAFVAARKFVEPYRMIRQTSKVFCLLPSLIAVAGVMAAGAVAGQRRAGTVALLVSAAASVEYFLQIQPVICVVDRQQPAYEAARDLARADGIEPRALIITLWPGDSHYTSIYQHYASLYRIRMVNGYRPFVAHDYIENIFRRFDSANLGHLDDQQLDELLARRVTFLIVHEDLFPEKVSPFPVTFTLHNLLRNPRIELVRADGPVWLFRILREPGRAAKAARDWNTFFPARRVEFETAKSDYPLAVSDDMNASGGRFLSLREAGANARFRSIPAVYAPSLRWLVRLRGHGSMSFDRFVGDTPAGSIPMQVAEDRWSWRTLPWAPFDGQQPLYFQVQLTEGAVDLDCATLLAGDWEPIAPGETRSLPAPLFFHAGHIELDRNTVSFHPGRDRSGLVLYGPKLPLQPGGYRFELLFDTDAEDGAPLGACILACPENKEVARFDVVAGSAASASVDLPQDLPMLAAFRFDGSEAVEIRSLEITRER